VNFVQRILVRAACAGLVGLAATGACAQQGYPSKPIRFLVPFAPGGVGDLTARVVAQKMSENLGQQVVIDNRPSAGMIVTAEAALKADPDGYTLVLTGNGTAVSASLFKSLPYDVLTDFIQVSTLAVFDLVLLANAGSRFQSVADVIAYARANPGKLNIGHVSIGSTQSLAAELFKARAAVDAVSVPYKATPAVINALRADDVQIAVEFVGPVTGQIRNRAVKPLAVMTDRRFAGLPEVPSLAESGLPAFQASSWNGVSVRAKTPAAIVERLNKEVVAAVNAPEVKQRLQDLGVEARASTPEQMRDLMASEIVKWRKVIEDAKIPRQ
jgi:tripartite-type tricarboxylate transporter receptor subunit TctC